jgi:hypothetical protein
MRPCGAGGRTTAFQVVVGGGVVIARPIAEHQVMTMPADKVAPNPVFSRDLAVLIGVLAVLEGDLMVGEVPDQLTDRIRDRFSREDLLRDGGNSRALRQAINDLNHRLRYGLGEYAEIPTPVPVSD